MKRVTGIGGIFFKADQPEALRAWGVTIDPNREDSKEGRFAWIIDPEGNRIELWEPPRSE